MSREIGSGFCDVVEKSIDDLQAMMSSGRATSRSLVLAYLLRIGKYDKDGPALNAILEVNPDAVQIAEAMDRERERSGPRGPLHGIPVVVKDNIDTGDKMHTSAGSLALAQSYAVKDSHVVSRLRSAGAVILAKTNMTEWANFMAQGMPSGYSSRGGQALNAYGPGVLDVGGSSSGSGSAVAACFAAVGVGTETSGSILSPASANGLVGLKPTVGLLGRSGIIPISHVQDTPGPMARTVRDLAILLGAMTGADELDPATWSTEGLAPSDYTSALGATDLKGVRIGLVRAGLSRFDEERAELFARAEEAIRDLGATVIEVTMKVPSGWAGTSLTYEFKPALNAYLGRLGSGASVHSLKELIEYNERSPQKMLRYGQVRLTMSEATSGTLTEPEYIRARALDDRDSRTEGIDLVMGTHRLDALLYPGIGCSSIAAKACYPSITLPVGLSQERGPMSISFVAGAWAEPTLLRIAHAVESAANWRKPPAL